jgi:hypothetical protein
LNLVLVFAYFGARLLVQLLGRVLTLGTGKWKRSEKGESLVASALARAREASSEYTVVERILDEYVADVFNYVDSAAQVVDEGDESGPVAAALVCAHETIARRFYEQLLRARASGCDEIHVVAHSLGTVVAFHALRGLHAASVLREDEVAVREACETVTRIYTIGSPLEKVRFFWPGLTPVENLLGDRSVRWDNFVAWLDPVAGRLRRFDQWGPVCNHYLLGGGFIRAHVVYERSARFIEAFAQGISGEQLRCVRRPLERLTDFMLLLGESLLAPVALLLVLLVGAAVVTLTIALLPFLFSFVLDLFGLQSLVQPVREYGVWMIGSMFLLVGLLNPWINARRIHNRYSRHLPD